MKNQGFTLIELLVVILIIGILAAIALPKYQTAVAKSQITRYFSLAKSLAEAQEAYYLANGKYAMSLKDLDVSIPSSCIIFTDISSKNKAYCDDSIVIDNQRSYQGGRYVSTGRIAVRYCPGHAREGEGACTTSSKGLLSIDFYLNHHDTKAGEIHCCAWNQKGKKLCQKLYSGQMILD